MALPSALATQLRTLLGALGAAAGPSSVSTVAGRALEAWLLMRLASRADASGHWHVSLRDGLGMRLTPGSSFKFPTSQAGIRPFGPATPGHVLLVNRVEPRIRLELHGNLQWMGRSGSSHELDVSLLPTAIAHPLRTAGGGHPRGLPIAAYECKDRASTASTDEMRQTVARLYDLALVSVPYPNWACRMFEPSVPTRWGRWRSTYRSLYAAGAVGVVRVGGFGPGAEHLGDHYHVHRHGAVYASARAITDLEDRFMHVLAHVSTV